MFFLCVSTGKKLSKTYKKPAKPFHLFFTKKAATGFPVAALFWFFAGSEVSAANPNLGVLASC